MSKCEAEIQELKHFISVRTDDRDLSTWIVKFDEQKKIINQKRDEIISLKRIQNQQQNGLKKLTYENDYPQKLKALMEELRFKKEKLRTCEETIKNMQKTAM